MPIPVNNNKKHYADKSVFNIFTKLIDNILSHRLQHSPHHCLREEYHEPCLDKLKESDNISIIINILQKESDDLLERWMISYDKVDTMGDSTHFIQSVVDLIQRMPANDIKSLYTISSFNNQSDQCYSYISTQDRIEFRSDAELKAQRFHLPSLSLEVVFDEKPRKKPTISLQSLSSPSFISWSKMQQSAPQQDEQVHPLVRIPTTTVSPTVVVNAPSSTPVIAVRRLSRLSLSAIDDNDEDNDNKDEEHYQEMVNPSFAIPIPSPRMQYTHHSGGHHRTTLAYSTSPNNLINNTTTSMIHNTNNRQFLSPTSPSPMEGMMIMPDSGRRSSLTDGQHYGCLVGSFEESLFSGRMSSMPSKPITFHSQIGVLGYGDCKPSLKCPPHWSIVFPATFYNLPQDNTPTTPYVGTVDIGEYASTQKKPQPGYRIPPKGQIQVVIKNPNKTAVKLFLIPYDVTDMPKNTKTFLRQKSYTVDQDKRLLRYAIHVQICRTEKKRIYLYKTMRVVFTNRKADAHEKFNVVCEGPREPVYIPLYS